MSIKNILVALAPRPDRDLGIDFAISMASALKAHIAARIYALEPEVPVGVFGGLPADLLQTHRARLKKDAEAAGKRFDQAAAKGKVEHSRTVELTTLSAAAADFARVARTHDLSVLTQPSEGIDHMGDVFIEAALFHSGRPIILVPKKGRTDFSLDRILISWDGGVNAARALAASMPLLALAKKIEVLSVGESSKTRDTLGERLAQNLERHGFDAEFKRREGDNVPRAILKEAEAWSASMLVMGAYGHSRLREFVFGGVTHFMTAQAPLPVLMMH